MSFIFIRKNQHLHFDAQLSFLSPNLKLNACYPSNLNTQPGLQPQGGDYFSQSADDTVIFCFFDPFLIYCRIWLQVDRQSAPLVVPHACFIGWEKAVLQHQFCALVSLEL
ncbi:hypothetical protein SLA2020_232430 [Shorea laevis]